MIMVEEMLREDARRRGENAAVFDPESGFGSVGERFLFKVSGSDDLYLPVSMREELLVKELLRRGSATKGEMARLKRLRLLHDFPYWAYICTRIKNKAGGDDIPFLLNRPQRKFVAQLERMRLENRPIRIIMLKARQWGGSTCSQLYIAWLQMVHKKGLNSLIIAHQGIGSDEIKDMFDRMIHSYPEEYLYEDWEKPPKGGKRMEGVGMSRGTYRVPARNCKIKIGTAERPDSCRGGDYSLVHCSEVGIWKATLGKTPEQILRSACSGVLLRPMTMIVYESTANGTGNFFHKEYLAARNGESQFEPIFISWYEIDQYSIEQTDEERRRLAEHLLAGRENDAVTSDRSESGRYLWWLWEKGATLDAIAWYRMERAKYSDHGLMAAEYPTDDVEAFVHTGARVFDHDCVEALRSGCIVPQYIGEIDIPGATDVASRIITDDERARLLRGVGFQEVASGGWKVWALPTVVEHIQDRYVAVVDVGGRSIKADWSVIVVFDRLPMMEGKGPEVVAQWRGHTDFDILAWKAAMAAQFYNEALLVIESNTLETRDRDHVVDGDQSCFILNRVRDIYPNLYARQQSEEALLKGLPLRYGFHTNVATKPMIIATLVKVIREGLYVERDGECLNEYQQYERRQNGSFAATAGHHDDLLMTRAIGLHISFHELPVPRVVINDASKWHVPWYGRYSQW